VHYELHTNFPSHNLKMEIVWKLFFHEFLFFAHGCWCLKHVWCMYKCGWKYFNHTYMCIICVLDAWYLCAKNTNPWNNKFHANFEWTYETNKFVTLYGKSSLSLFVRPMIVWIMHLWIKFISLSQTLNYSNCVGIYHDVSMFLFFDFKFELCVHVIYGFHNSCIHFFMFMYFSLWFLNWTLWMWFMNSTLHSLWASLVHLCLSMILHLH
jgi:hypothetical protein